MVSGPSTLVIVGDMFEQFNLTGKTGFGMQTLAKGDV